MCSLAHSVYNNYKSSYRILTNRLPGVFDKQHLDIKPVRMFVSDKLKFVCEGSKGGHCSLQVEDRQWTSFDVDLS